MSNRRSFPEFGKEIVEVDSREGESDLDLSLKINQIHL
jgi:hypothetical protein